VTLSLTVAPGDDPDGPERPSVEHLTFRRDDDGFHERRHLRGIHPLIAGRLDLWRFEHFALTRLPSSDSTYLFHATPTTTPTTSGCSSWPRCATSPRSATRTAPVVALPELEQVLAACLDDLRRARAAEPPAGPDWNRVMLNVWPPVTVPGRGARAGGAGARPDHRGLGLEQVTVQATLALPGTATPPRWWCACRGHRARASRSG
jgi:hypothetical protein